MKDVKIRSFSQSPNMLNFIKKYAWLQLEVREFEFKKIDKILQQVPKVFKAW